MFSYNKNYITLKCSKKMRKKQNFKIKFKNKRAQRALGRSPEEKVKGHSGAI